MADELDPQKTGEAGSQQSEESKPPPGSVEGQEGSQEKEAAESGEEGKEPGGADGQAVYQRKLYRENKQLQDRLRQEEIDKARLIERLKITEETLAKQPPQAPPPIYTVAQLEAAVVDGRITREDAERYKFEVIVPRQVQAQTEARERERLEREARERPLNEARRSLGEYTRLYPWLADPTDRRTQEISQRYNYLVTNRGLGQNEITSELAISQVLGPIDKATQRKEVDSLTSRNTGTFAETGAGGANNPSAQSANIANAPATMKAYWNKAGLTEAQRKKEYQIYQDLRAKGK